MIQQKPKKIKGLADIVFCIDFSGSMTYCIKGVCENINNFIKSLETSNRNVYIDWRIGFCAYSDTDFYILKFVKDTHIFSNTLSQISLMGDEFTAGALDFSISEFEWRHPCTKVIALFTDETLETGYIHDGVKEKFPALLDKIANSKIKLYYFGPDCHYYRQFEFISGCVPQYIQGDNFDGIDFSDLFIRLGKTVSQSCNQTDNAQISSKEKIFNLNNIKIHYF